MVSARSAAARAAVRTLSGAALDDFLRTRSGLPGPRANRTKKRLPAGA
ncbi:MAG: hypothetical protein HOV79_24640 [Hamadaea sp.]|nr:hypothetical protein [Hamadaea sp.]